MIEKLETTEQLVNGRGAGEQQSIFHDRNESHFGRWLEEQGLPMDASDEMVIHAMASYLETRNSASISH